MSFSDECEFWSYGVIGILIQSYSAAIIYGRLNVNLIENDFSCIVNVFSNSSTNGLGSFINGRFPKYVLQTKCQKCYLWIGQNVKIGNRFSLYKNICVNMTKGLSYVYQNNAIFSSYFHIRCPHIHKFGKDWFTWVNGMK